MEAIIREKARPHELEMNLVAAKFLFSLILRRTFSAYHYEKQFIQVGPGRTVPIELNYYLVEGGEVIFQYLQPRAEPAFDDRTALCLMSLVHMAYAFGDFASANVELADLSAPKRGENRKPRFRIAKKEELLMPADLSAEINDVYDIMKKLYEEA